MTLPRLACAVRAGLFASALLVPGSAQAQEPSFELVWARGRGADGCEASEAIEQRVTRRLGRNPFSQSATRRIEAVIENVEDRWIARLHVRDEDGRSLGTRELTSDAEACESIQAAAVLAIALAIDPDAAIRPEPEASQEPVEAPAPASPGPEPEPVVTVPATPPPAPVAARPVVVEPTRLAPDPSWTSLTLRGGFASGLTPATSGLVGLRWSAGSGSLALTADALWVDESDTEDGLFSFGLTAFGAGACYVAGSGEALSAGVCATAWLGSVHAVVREIRATDPGSRTFVATSFGATGRAVIAEPLHVELGADLFTPLIRKQYDVTGWDEPAWKPPAAALTVHGGLGVSFW